MLYTIKQMENANQYKIGIQLFFIVVEKVFDSIEIPDDGNKGNGNTK